MERDLEQIKERHAIADVVAAHGVELRPSGRRFTAACPFHADRRASFVVYPETRRYYCFGCGAGGDVIDFTRRIARVGFREALALLDGAAPSASGTRPRRRRAAPRTSARLTLEDRLILLAACELYHETLMRTPGMLRYLETRGVDPVLARRCRVGFSDGTQLEPYLRRRRLSVRRAEAMGLLFDDGGETLAGRIVIPDLRDGYCGWLVGRAVDGRREPRYRGVALPRPLLGYARARGHDRLLVTEGPFDWLTLVGWGLPACALLGTQPSADALRLLRRADAVVLVLDGDEPGRAAAAQIADAVGATTRIVTLPPGVKDVNDLGTRVDGQAQFFQALAAAERRAADVAPAG